MIFHPVTLLSKAEYIVSVPILTFTNGICPEPFPDKATCGKKDFGTTSLLANNANTRKL